MMFFLPQRQTYFVFLTLTCLDFYDFLVHFFGFRIKLILHLGYGEREEKWLGSLVGVGE